MFVLFAILYRVRGGGLVNLGSTFLARMVFCLPFSFYVWNRIHEFSGPFVKFLILHLGLVAGPSFVVIAAILLSALYAAIAMPWTDELMVANKKLSERISRTFMITALPAAFLAAFGVPALLFALSGFGIGVIYHLCWWWNIRWFNQGPTEIAEYMTGAWLGLSALTIGLI